MCRIKDRLPVICNLIIAALWGYFIVVIKGVGLPLESSIEAPGSEITQSPRGSVGSDPRSPADREREGRGKGKFLPTPEPSYSRGPSPAGVGPKTSPAPPAQAPTVTLTRPDCGETGVGPEGDAAEAAPRHAPPRVTSRAPPEATVAPSLTLFPPPPRPAPDHAPDPRDGSDVTPPAPPPPSRCSTVPGRRRRREGSQSNRDEPAGGG